MIATVTGRTAAGRRAAVSHTASLATDDRLLDAMLRQAGVIRTRTGLQMLDAARVIVDQPRPAGPRVGIITNSGGTGVELTDLLVDQGLSVPELSPGLQATLRELLPANASAGNPVDMTPVWPRFTELYPVLIDRLASSGEVDVVVPILLQRAASGPVATAVRDAVATPARGRQHHPGRGLLGRRRAMPNRPPTCCRPRACPACTGRNAPRRRSVSPSVPRPSR